MTDTNKDIFYNIINEAINLCANDADIAVNNDISEFKQRIHRQNIFDEDTPTLAEINYAQSFCDDLDDFRISIDVYAKENTPISSHQAQRILDALEYFSLHITPENNTTVQWLKDCMHCNINQANSQTFQTQRDISEEYYRRNFPPPTHKTTVLPPQTSTYTTPLDTISHYEEQMESIIVPFHKRLKEKTPLTREETEYAKKILNIIKTISADKSLDSTDNADRTRNIITTAINTINLIPSKISGRVLRFTLKRDLNTRMHNMSLQEVNRLEKEISPTSAQPQKDRLSKYKILAKKSFEEKIRWEKARECATQPRISHNPQDEYLYK